MPVITGLYTLLMPLVALVLLFRRFAPLFPGALLAIATSLNYQLRSVAEAFRCPVGQGCYPQSKTCRQMRCANI